jgi:hypothetical protein
LACFNYALILQLDLLVTEEPGAIGTGFVSIAISDQPLVADVVYYALISTQGGVFEHHQAFVSPPYLNGSLVLFELTKG